MPLWKDYADSVYGMSYTQELYCSQCRIRCKAFVSDEELGEVTEYPDGITVIPADPPNPICICGKELKLDWGGLFGYGLR